MKLIARRFDESNRHIDQRLDDLNQRLDALERRQREDSKAFSAQMVDLRKDAATLGGPRGRGGGNASRRVESCPRSRGDSPRRQGSRVVGHGAGCVRRGGL